jgi:hypothetical protein
MVQKTFPVYDHPSYTARCGTYNSVMTAGSAGVSAKFVAFANLLLFGLNTQVITAGTSTYTNTVTGVGTNIINSQQLNLIRITQTQTQGATIALSTSTVGPFIAAGNFAAGGTGTGQIGGYNQFALNTTAPTLGGFPINQGDQIYIVSGTDATGVALVSIDYQVQPLAAVVA